MAKHEKERDELHSSLQGALAKAVRHGYLDAVERAGEAMKEHSVKLDFCISEDTKLRLPKCKTPSPLMMALELGRTDIAEKLLKLGASAAFKNKRGWSSLHIACSKGMVEMTELLLTTARDQKNFGKKKDSDCEDMINAKEKSRGWTPLMYAVKGGHIDTVKVLMECEFLKYDLKNKNKQNVNHVAAKENQLDCLKLLYDQSRNELFLTKDKKEWNLLHQVCCNGNVEMIKWLLETIPELKARDNLNKKSQQDYTPLLVACEYQKIEMIKYLTQELTGVDVGACCHSDDAGRGTSGLHLAAIHNSAEMAELLMDANCPLDLVDTLGNTALHVANIKYSRLVAWIVERKCKEKKVELSSVKNKDGLTPSEVVRGRVVIPSKIKKLGPEAEEIYLRALDEGEQKIPYCGLLILGREHVGKTSLYRQLVGKEFKEDLESTRGIDNNTVDTVDRRVLDVEAWQEKEATDAGEQFGDAVINMVVPQLPEKPSEEAQEEKEEKVVKENDLIAKIQRIKNKLKERERHAAVRPPLSKPKVEHSLSKQAPQDPTPRKKLATSEPEISGSSGMLNRRQRDRLNSIVKRGKEVFEPIEPALVLNALDFAGQKEYRPMHHCFIRRRAIYVVVFKIPDLLDKSLRCSAIEEMRYWVHSIHAHIYPPDESMRGADKKMQRVFLVGTHRGEQKLSKESFNEINGLVEELTIDDRCINHVCPVKLPDYGSSFFIPVENSLDKKRGGCYLVESGTKPLQEEIKAMCKDRERLPFLHESHPIKWLQFEKDLIDFSKVKKPPIVTLKEVDEIAVDCKITHEEAKNPALHFLHDTGKIICLNRLPHLFLREEECQMLQELIVLDPDWLITLMKVVTELDPTKDVPGIRGDQIRDLSSRGIADSKFLEIIWGEFISPASGIEVRHLCLILQAYCLIYPVKMVVSMVKESLTQQYIVPCKFPSNIESLPRWVEKCVNFYFNFNGFLPEKIYHRLVCLMLSEAKHPQKKLDQNCYSSKICIFYGIQNTNWKIEMEGYEQRLKIGVVLMKKTPIEYIQFIHKKLFDICQQSGMEGLQYYGGPTCKNCKVVLCCVEYNAAGVTEAEVSPTCVACTEEYNVNELLLESLSNLPEPAKLVSCTAPLVDSGFPGILFWDTPILECITSQGATIRSTRTGISLSIPKQALSSTEKDVNLLIHPCFSGPFKLPDGYESASPAYLIQTSRRVQFHDATLQIHHYAKLRGEKDCEEMAFLSASPTPHYQQSEPVYVFEEIKQSKGSFRPNSQVGEVKLQHFCITKVGRKRGGNSQSEASVSKRRNIKPCYYSARLYRAPSLLQTSLNATAVFCMCLYHPLYNEYCDAKISEEYKLPCRGEARSDCFGEMIENEATLSVQNSEGYRVTFDRGPTKIEKRELDLPEYFKVDLSQLTDYPPKFSIFVNPISEATMSARSPQLVVQGLDRKFTFEIFIPSRRSMPALSHHSQGSGQNVPAAAEGSQTLLSTADKAAIMRALLDVAAKCDAIALVLGVRHGKRETLKREQPRCEDRLEAYVDEWLRGNTRTECTWVALCRVLRDLLVERGDVADKIERGV